MIIILQSSPLSLLIQRGLKCVCRRVSSLEEDLEKTEEKLLAAATKLDKASTACDDSERAKKVFQSKAEEDEKRIGGLEKDLKDARDKAETADITYEVGR